MIEGFLSLLAIHLAMAVERAQELLFLGVDTQDRMARGQELLDQFGDVTESLVPINTASTRQHFGECSNDLCL